jgi:hypothetical protein
LEQAAAAVEHEAAADAFGGVTVAGVTALAEDGFDAGQEEGVIHGRGRGGGRAERVGCQRRAEEQCAGGAEER